MSCSCCFIEEITKSAGSEAGLQTFRIRKLGKLRTTILGLPMVFNDTRVDGSCQCVFFSGVKRGWRMDLTTLTSIGPFEVELQWPNVSQQQEWPHPKKSPTEIKKSRRKTVKRTGRLREWSMVPKHSMHKWSNHGKESWKNLAFSWSASVIYISYYLKLVICTWIRQGPEICGPGAPLLFAVAPKQAKRP